MAHPVIPLPRGNGHLSGVLSWTSLQGPWAPSRLGLEDQDGLGGGRQGLATSSTQWPMCRLAQLANVILVEVSGASPGATSRAQGMAAEGVFRKQRPLEAQACGGTKEELTLGFLTAVSLVSLGEVKDPLSCLSLPKSNLTSHLL